eukprot:GHVL01045053.1.p1 GENE.GHVL01045053.1~~GHVL01045053.1.p1  ORF type:complete len:409 (+),score=73.60 GHVL01045053.1:73-1299(+)
MGRNRKAVTSKTGKKILNPTDAHRKAERNKEKKRNRKDRETVRQEAMIRKDPRSIKEQIEKLNQIEKQGKLDRRLVAKRQRLDSLWQSVQDKQRLEQITRVTDLQGFGDPVVHHADAPLKSFTDDWSDASEDDDDENEVSSEQSDSEEAEQNQEVMEENSSSRLVPPPLPPGLPSHLLNRSHEMTSYVSPPLPLGPPPPSVLLAAAKHSQQCALGDEERAFNYYASNPIHHGGPPTPMEWPSRPYVVMNHQWDIPLLPQPISAPQQISIPQPNNPPHPSLMAPSKNVSYANESIPSAGGLQFEPTATTSGSSSSAPKQPLFVPTSLRSQQSKLKSTTLNKKMSSVTQVTGFSTQASKRTVSAVSRFSSLSEEKKVADNHINNPHALLANSGIDKAFANFMKDIEQIEG